MRDWKEVLYPTQTN